MRMLSLNGNDVRMQTRAFVVGILKSTTSVTTAMDVSAAQTPPGHLAPAPTPAPAPLPTPLPTPGPAQGSTAAAPTRQPAGLHTDPRPQGVGGTPSPSSSAPTTQQAPVRTAAPPRPTPPAVPASPGIAEDVNLLPVEDPWFSGWFEKQPEKRGKSKRRFLELYMASVPAEIRYYQAVRTDPVSRCLVGKKLKGSLKVDMASNVGCQGLALTIRNPDRLWVLSAESEAQAEAWAGMLRTIVADARAVHQGLNTGLARADADPAARCRVCSNKAMEGGGSTLSKRDAKALRKNMKKASSAERKRSNSTAATFNLPSDTDDSGDESSVA